MAATDTQHCFPFQRPFVKDRTVQMIAPAMRSQDVLGIKRGREAGVEPLLEVSIMTGVPDWSAGCRPTI